MGRLLLDGAQRRDWLRLISSENVGPITFRQLINRFGSAADALSALPDLARRGGLSRPIRLYPAADAERDIERIAALGAKLVAYGEEDYPALLREIDSAPPLLCLKGQTSLLALPCVAIVGARNASALGRKFARQLAAELAQAGFLVVSGLARGIDTAAHEASLSVATAAVLAGGIDIVYPPENADLHGSIGARGVLIAECMPRTTPTADHFPRRNRLISGMSYGTLVIEAAVRSGSLITARLAAEQGREVFAVPGSPLDPRAGGTNKLLREGATLITSAADVLETLAPVIGRPVRVKEELMREDEDTVPLAEEMGSGEEHQRILQLLGPAPVEVDDLIRESGLKTSLVVAILLELELAGLVVRQRRNHVSLA
jgi:DNA processing protein